MPVLLLTARCTLHVHYQGAELEVLKSINWSLVKFDVLCIETDPPNRPEEFASKLTEFLGEKGYINYSGQVGRNICKCRKEANIFF
jgi:hypothetical protein